MESASSDPATVEAAVPNRHRMAAAGADRGRPRQPVIRRPLSEPSDDLALVERMLEGEESAFEAFAERCFRPLYRFASARLRGDRELTLEIVQTTLAKAIAKLDGYRGEATLTSWLLACCRNEILMRARHLKSSPDEVEIDERHEPAAGFRSQRPDDAEETLLRAEEAALVHAALDRLPERYARALEWKYLERLPVREIADRLGTSAKAAESLLTRARAAFRADYLRLQSG